MKRETFEVVREWYDPEEEGGPGIRYIMPSRLLGMSIEV